MGLLRIRGTINVDQFWPKGTSDADTTKILLSVQPGSFAFAANGKNFKATHVYDNAIVHGTVRKSVITKGKVTIRLQGIDAPELHYRAGALPRKNSVVTEEQRQKFNKLNLERRQYWGESATVALAAHLKPLAKNGEIECEAVSAIDHPNDLLDTYGRIVANIRVGSKYKEDINVWLAKAGWVFPTFYSSMSEQEIQSFLDAMTQGQKKDRVWRKLSGDASVFDSKLLFRKAGSAIDASNDRGPLLMPKLYRRQVAYRMHRGAGLFEGTFEKYLTDHADECFLLKDFLTNSVHSAKTHHLHEFVKGARFSKKPHELVFKEKPSTVVDQNGKPIQRF